MNRVSTISDEAIDQLPQRPIHEELDDASTEAETIKAIKQLSLGKAASTDGIPAEIYKCKPVAVDGMQLFNVIWDREAVLQDFKYALFVHLFKSKSIQTHL